MKTSEPFPPGTVIKWAVHAPHQGSIAFIEGMQEHWPRTRPNVGDVLTLPFIVDPVTREPVEVAVVDLLGWTDRTPPEVGIVVMRTRQH